MPLMHDPLVDTAWLETHLDDADLRILDCTVFLRPRQEGGFSVESGREHWSQGHIPGAVHADLKHELSDPNTRLRFMLPSAAQFADAMSRYGVGEGTRVVLYDAASNMWAARVWWMLRVFGFDDAAVLDGGWKKWKAEGRPISTEVPEPAPANFVPRPREGLMATKDDVLEAMEQRRAACIIDALAEDQHQGRVNTYGRRGHIPGSANIPAMQIVDPETNAYLPIEQLREKFQAAGALDSQRVITYCGGGIAASSDAFVLTMLGHPDVAVYDASLSEWAEDPSLPMEARARWWRSRQLGVAAVCDAGPSAFARERSHR
ncbi:MAG: sulfurtransferase [Dehalococcoidia bacterium]|nr:sulfurtransferase [Dehalococcoidia bacterium]